MVHIVDKFALIVGYLVMVASSLYTLYWMTLIVGELIIKGENRILLALKIQPAMLKYFRNREQIDAWLKSEWAGKSVEQGQING